MNAEEKPINSKKTIKRLWSYLKKEKKKLIIIIIMVIITTLASVIGPLLMSIIVDEYIAISHSKIFIYLLLVLILIYIINFLFSWITSFIMTKITETSLYNIRKDLFIHLEKLSLSYFDKNKKGDIMSRFTNDVSIISDALSEAVIQVISSTITLIGVTIMMFIVNPILAITTIITVPIYFLIMVKIGIKAGKGFSLQQKSLGNLNSSAEELISNMQVVKSYTKEEKAITSFETFNQKLKNDTIKAEMIANFMMPLNMAITNINQILLITVGAFLTVNGKATVGGILAFISYSSMFRRPINQLASLFASIQAALAGAERIFEVIDEKIEVKDASNTIPFDDIKGDVIMDNVNFSYVKGKEILKDININVKKGERIALVGPTGAGKTTIINLLTRFYDINKGVIKIDNKDISKIKQDDLRKKIGVVLQDTYLFKGTVFDNIRYGNMNATMEEVIEASKKAEAHSFIHRLPDSYNSFIEEEGNNLSQGQRQLIAIARAILSNPSILILDEATSSVDTRTEKAINIGMDALMKDRTSFVIAHRLSTIENADRILVINDGMIIEEGTHQELLKQQGFYYNLYMSQFTS